MKATRSTIRSLINSFLPKGSKISSVKFTDALIAYNGFRMPISELIQLISEKPQEFLQFVIEKNCYYAESIVEDNNRVHITDHAILRYLERSNGIDIEDIRKEMLSKKMLRKILKEKGDGDFVFKNLRYVVKNYKVVTVVPVN